MCILKTFNRIHVKPEHTQDDNSVAGVMYTSDWELTSNNKHFELEIVCRICIFAVYGANVSLEAFNYWTNLHYQDLPTTLDDKPKNKMAARIERFTTKLKKFSAC